ncbi:MAG: trehalose-phosphatase [Pseudomonadota bacterium]
MATSSSTNLPVADITGAALFLDFDGTLVGFADNPEEVAVPPRLGDWLSSLKQRTSGALAIVTGRQIASIDDFLSPLILPVAGVHGLEKRLPDGRRMSQPVPADAFGAIVDRMKAFAARHEGLLVEDKGASAVLHFRRRPELEAICQEAAHAALGPSSDFEVKPGHCIVEIKSALANKGTAVQDFMALAPFKGRRPIFVGDDVTDEDGFREVNKMGGMSIKVGHGDTLAKHRFASPDTVHQWLAQLTAPEKTS